MSSGRPNKPFSIEFDLGCVLSPGSDRVPTPFNSASIADYPLLRITHAIISFDYDDDAVGLVSLNPVMGGRVSFLFDGVAIEGSNRISCAFGQTDTKVLPVHCLLSPSLLGQLQGICSASVFNNSAGAPSYMMAFKLTLIGEYEDM